jgi:FkbM family methyltransferase
VAIEALPSTYDVTVKNLGLPSIAEQCRVLNAAIWSNNESISIMVPSSGAYSRASVGALGDIKVRALRLDTLLEQENIEKVDLLKVDIEGAEVEMFRNADDWLDRIDALAVEFHDNSRSASQFDSFMVRHGFKVDQASSHTVYAARS